MERTARAKKFRQEVGTLLTGLGGEHLRKSEPDSQHSADVFAIIDTPFGPWRFYVYDDFVASAIECPAVAGKYAGFGLGSGSRMFGMEPFVKTGRDALNRFLVALDREISKTLRTELTPEDIAERDAQLADYAQASYQFQPLYERFAALHQDPPPPTAAAAVRWYSALHNHKYGVSTYLFTAPADLEVPCYLCFDPATFAGDPALQDLLEQLGIAFEPQRGETVEVSESSDGEVVHITHLAPRVDA